MTPQIPLTRDLVLIGGGHTHALVLRHFAMKPLPGLRITVINPAAGAPYTGMLPGHIAGHYDRDDLEIDLYRLARRADARLVRDIVSGIDLGEKTVRTISDRTIAYDIASFDIGVTSTLYNVEGFAEHGVAAKPLGPFAARWRAFLEAGGAGATVVLGGGVAGVELAFAMEHRLRTAGHSPNVAVMDKGNALEALPKHAARTLRERLRAAKITLIEHADVVRITEDAVHLSDGRSIPSAFTVSAAGARPFPWVAETGLALEDGFITVDRYLQTSDPFVFASGDCAHLSHAPRPKAGVYAVRAAPVLAQNLTAALGSGTRRPFQPQRDYLKLVSLGEKSALAEKAGIALSGPWLWRWKDRIDRDFMAKLNDSSAMQPPPLPARVARGVREELSGKAMLCAGCGAKVGGGALRTALEDLPAARPPVTRAPGDDAALLDIGGETQVLTTDHLPAFTGDPALFARIAACHAMGDVWAMGASPEAVLAQITLPRMSAALQTRTLREIMVETAAVFEASGATIAGGHTIMGPELVIGFTVTGRTQDGAIGLDGAKRGDVLLLTRPIGSGVLLAADMSGQARGHDLAGLFDTLSRPQGDAAAILRTAHAMTDVTGFGLAGHLSNIVQASAVAAEVHLNAVPVYPGVHDLARAGVRSSIWEANRAAVMIDAPDTPEADLLFDPQTAGGLLAALPEKAAAIALADLEAAGHQAAIVGHLRDGPTGISVV